MHVFGCGYHAALFCAIQFTIQSGCALAIPMNSTAARSLMHGSKELKVVYIRDVVQIFFLKHVVYT